MAEEATNVQGTETEAGTPAEKTYTQDEVNTLIQNRLAGLPEVDKE